MLADKGQFEVFETLLQRAARGIVISHRLTFRPVERQVRVLKGNIERVFAARHRFTKVFSASYYRSHRIPLASAVWYVSTGSKIPIQPERRPRRRMDGESWTRSALGTSDTHVERENRSDIRKGGDKSWRNAEFVEWSPQKSPRLPKTVNAVNVGKN